MNLGATLSNLRQARRGLWLRFPTRALCAFLALAALAWSENSAVASALADLSIEQLMDEPVTSVSKKEIHLEESAAAISVVTQEDIRRLGISSIPEALRLVPGMDVAQVGASRWAISARGFNGEFANKLLVLIDGRTVYSSSFSGVYWELQDVVMEDIERIEVIRGPGASLWGANAVNGVVNIITKRAQDTQGFLVSTSFGTEDQPSTSVRYGGKIGKDLYFRAYLKYSNLTSFRENTGQDAHDGWNSSHGGFRLDWTPSSIDSVMVQGDCYYTETSGLYDSAIFTPPFRETDHIRNYDNGGDVLARWTHHFSSTSELTIQSYYDHINRGLGDLKLTEDTEDIDLQHRFALGARNDVIWGLGYRHIVNDLLPSSTLSLNRERNSYDLYTAFLQDQITLLPDRLSLILGSKFEHNDFTDYEIQPNARLLWTPGKKQTVWASVSRAVRTPSPLDTEESFTAAVVQPSPFSPPVEVVYKGVPTLQSETVIAYELGYRVEPAQNLSLDIATFYNVYSRLEGSIPTTPYFQDGHIVEPVVTMNSQHGTSYGLEASVQWKVNDRWRLSASYSWLHMRLHPDLGQDDNSPENQFQIRSYVDLPYHLEFNSSLAYVDRIITALPPARIPAYVRLDLGLVWHVTKSIDVGVWGQNLLDNHRPEYSNLLSTSLTEIPRSVIGKITFSF